MNESIFKEEINRISMLNDGDLNVVIAQMTILVNALVSDRDDIDGMIGLLKKQTWYKRMWDMPIGEIKVTKEEFAQKKDRMIVYMIQVISFLFEKGRINQDILISLGEKFKEIYYWVMRDSFEKLVIEDSVIQIRDMVGRIAAALNKKIESEDNFEILLKQIDNHAFQNPDAQVIQLCRIAARIDSRTLEDSVKLERIRKSMEKLRIFDIYSYIGSSVQDGMRYIADIPQNITGEVYLGLSVMNNNFVARLLSEFMEKYNMLPNVERMATDCGLVIHQIMFNNAMYGCADIWNIFQVIQEDYSINLYTFQKSIAHRELFDSFIESRKETADVLAKVRFDK